MMKNENVYAMVTERIIEQLENGIIPWHKPWFGTPEGAWSRSTGRPYSLINQLLLEKPGEYLTFKQVQEANGKVKKGAKAKTVVFFKPYKITEKDDEGNETEKTIPLLRYYQVFHIDDTENVKPSREPQTKNNEPIATAEAIIYNYTHSVDAPKFVNDKPSNEAYYRPSTDTVVVPMITQYENIEEYYSTAFHELTHSTLKESRCNRRTENAKASFGSEEYSKEELVAELGAASLVNISGIETEKSFKNSTAYIQSWLKALRNDVKLITLASTKAGQAVDYITNAEAVEDVPEETQDAPQENTKDVPKYQESVYNKYTKKNNFRQTTENAFGWFTNGEMLFGSSNLTLEGDLKVQSIVDDMIIKGERDNIDVDMLKFDIKALKALKEKHVIVRTESKKLARFNITYVQDALKFVNVKKGFTQVKCFKKGNTIAFTFVNENGYALILNCNDEKLEENYDSQCEKVADYYKVLNK